MKRQLITQAWLLGLLIIGINGYSASDMPNDTVTKPASGPTTELLRLRGTVQSMQDGNMVLLDRSGKTLYLQFPDNAGVQEIFPIPFTNIKIGDTVGSTGMPKSEHSYQALEVRRFPDTGPPENQRESNLTPGSILTNGHVVAIDNTAHNRKLVLTVKDQEITILVDDDTPIATYGPGDMTLLKPGAEVYLHAIQTGLNQYRGASATVGKGMTPPQ